MSESVSPRVWQRPNGNEIRRVRYGPGGSQDGIDLLVYREYAPLNMTANTDWTVLPADAIELVPVSRVEALEAELAEAKAAPSLPTPDAEDPVHADFVRDWFGNFDDDELAVGHGQFEAYNTGEIGEFIRGCVLELIDRIEAERAEEAAHDQLIEQVAHTISGQGMAFPTTVARALAARFDITPKAEA